MKNKPFRTFADQLRDFSPPTADAFGALRKACRDYGPIDAKHRELIMLAGFAVARAEGGFRVHVRIALENGATLTEINQAVLLTLSASLPLGPAVNALEWARTEYEAVKADKAAARI